MSEIVAVFLVTFIEDEDNLAEAHRLTRCGNMTPLTLTEHPSLKKFTGTRAVDWVDSETIDETRIKDETDSEYEQRMQVAVNTALSDLQSGKFEASIMSDELFVSARGSS